MLERSLDVLERHEISFIFEEQICTCFGIREREERDLSTEFLWTLFRSDSKCVFSNYWNGVSSGPG